MKKGVTLSQKPQNRCAATKSRYDKGCRRVSHTSQNFATKTPPRQVFVATKKSPTGVKPVGLSHIQVKGLPLLRLVPLGGGPRYAFPMSWAKRKRTVTNCSRVIMSCHI